jgi:hypothetical protein
MILWFIGFYLKIATLAYDGSLNAPVLPLKLIKRTAADVGAFVALTLKVVFVAAPLCH